MDSAVPLLKLIHASFDTDSDVTPLDLRAFGFTSQSLLQNWVNPVRSGKEINSHSCQCGREFNRAYLQYGENGNANDLQWLAPNRVDRAIDARFNPIEFYELITSYLRVGIQCA